MLSLLLIGSLFACRKNDASRIPGMSEANEEYTPSPFADTNYTKRYYLANSAGTVYGDNYYYCSGDMMTIVAVPLSEAIQ